MKKTFLSVTESATRRFVFSEAGRYAVYFHNISGRLELDIQAPGVELYVFGLYTGQEADRFELSTLQLHGAPSSSSNLFVKGVFRDRSQFIYDGLIRIEKNGDGSHAYQKNQNLMLSEDAFVSSKPELEILAQDVFCTHGSTTGRLNRKQQFYLGSRGLDEKANERLLVNGFIRQLFSQMETLDFAKEATHYKQLILADYD